MNYYQAREMTGPDGKGAGRWHYTVRNDDNIRPVGYCSPWDTCPDCKGYSGILRRPDGPEHCERCDDKGLIKRPDALICHGHDTPEGAQEHYRLYLLDHVRYDGRMENQMQRCRVCQEYTEHYAHISWAGHLWVLCDAHRNRDEVDKLLTRPEYIVSSY